MPSEKALNYLEERRLKGVAVTGKELKGKFGQAETDDALRRQKKKLNPNSDPNADIMDSQSKLRKFFSKGS